MSKLLSLHLRCYEILASYAWAARLMIFKSRPKHHVVWHMSQDILRTRVNPKVWSCSGDESFLGRLKHIAVMCHARATSLRTFQRYVLALADFINFQIHTCFGSKGKRSRGVFCRETLVIHIAAGGRPKSKRKNLHTMATVGPPSTSS